MQKEKYFAIILTLVLWCMSLNATAQLSPTTAPEEDPASIFESENSFPFTPGFLNRQKKISFPKALQLNEQRLRIAEQNNNSHGIAAASSRLAMIWLGKNNFAKALDYLNKALIKYKQTNDKKGIAVATAAIGYTYQQTEEDEKALQYYYNSYELSKELKLQKINASVAGFMAIIYTQKKESALANQFLKESIQGFSLTKDRRAKADLLNKMGEIFVEQNNIAGALEYFSQSTKLKEELNDSLGLAMELRNTGIAYFKKGDYEKALDYFNQSLKISGQSLVKKLVKDTYLKLATVYSYRKDFAKADKYHEQYRLIKEVIAAGENSTRLTSDQLAEEVTEKEKIIKLLNTENEEQAKIMNQQGLELSRQLTETELERQSKERALEELNLATLERKEKEKQLLLVSKENAEKELSLSKKELQLSRNTMLTNLLIGVSLIILLVLFFTYNRYRYKKKSHDELNRTNNELTSTLDKLKATQDQLVHAQKMASLGQLTAGIAHEIQNPLNFVTNFSGLSVELLEDLETTGTEEEKKELIKGLKKNLEKISHHGSRADHIVKSMLQHSRSGSDEKQLTDINKLAEEYSQLAYHGVRATDPGFKCRIEKNLLQEKLEANIVPQDISRVILNLFNNAFYAVMEKSKTASELYEPVVGISTHKSDNRIVIKIMDNGNGIPAEIKDKIFNPFFTTKPTGKGTGIGLSLSYDIIVHGHGGSLKADSRENEGSTFIIELPL